MTDLLADLTAQPAPEPAGSTQKPRALRSAHDRADQVFRGIARSSGIFVLIIMGAVGLFLLVRAMQALKAVGPWEFLTTQDWNPDVHHFGIAAVLLNGIFIALVAVSISVPLSLGTALFISQVAPARIKRTLVTLVDLMAAVPSVVFGLWGFFFLQKNIVGIARWMSTWLSWIPIFKVDGTDPRDPLSTSSVYTASIFVAGIVVSLMIAPIQCAIMREVFDQAPLGEREGALALGATRWGMIRSVVLPFGKGGIIGGTMLGLGRALGETIAIYMIISPVFSINFHILKAGGNSVSSLIALRYGDASQFGMSALMAAGLALFILTLIVNFSASAVVARSRSGAQSEG
jgi:phosphate transport system permease protein